MQSAAIVYIKPYLKDLLRQEALADLKEFTKSGDIARELGFGSQDTRRVSSLYVTRGNGI
jgi:hypothetical protein